MPEPMPKQGHAVAGLEMSALDADGRGDGQGHRAGVAEKLHRAEIDPRIQT